MDEIHLWQWRYTDDFGKRRIFPCRLSVEDGNRLRRRARRRLARDSPAHSTDQRLAALAAAVRVDRCFESSWELFRYGLFKGLTHEEASAKLDAWSRRQRIAAEFEIRKVSDMDVMFVILRAGPNSGDRYSHHF